MKARKHKNYIFFIINVSFFSFKWIKITSFQGSECLYWFKRGTRDQFLYTLPQLLYTLIYTSYLKVVENCLKYITINVILKIWRSNYNRKILQEVVKKRKIISSDARLKDSVYSITFVCCVCNFAVTRLSLATSI